MGCSWARHRTHISCIGRWILYHCCYCSIIQSCPTVQQHELQHTRLACPSPSPRVCSNSCPLSRWCHPTVSSSVAPLLLPPSIFPSIGVFSSESTPQIRWPEYRSVSWTMGRVLSFSSTLEMFFIIKSPSLAQSSTNRLPSTLDLVCVFGRIYNKWNHTVCYLWGLASFTQFNVFEVHPHCLVYQHIAFCCWVVFKWISRSRFVYFPIDWHVSYHFLPVINKGTISILMQICVWMFNFFWANT